MTNERTNWVQPVIISAVMLAVAAAAYVMITMDWKGTGSLPNVHMDELPATDPALVRYREAAPLVTLLDTAMAIAVGPDGVVYVAGDKCVRWFEQTVVRDKFPLHAEPHCLAVGPDGTFYVGLADHVEVFAADGVKKAEWKSPGEKAFLTSIAVDGEDIYVADAGNLVVHRYDKAGNITAELARKDPARKIDGLVLPSAYLDVAVGRDGLVRIANPGRLRIETYTRDGDLMSSWGKSSNAIDGFSGCCNPAHFALLPDGRTVTTEKNIPRIKVYDKDGKLESVVAGHESFAALMCPTADGTKGKALDVAVGAKGEILVLDPSSRNVRVFWPKNGADK